MRYTQIIKYSLYNLKNIVKRKPITSSSYLPLYQSKVFQNHQDFETQLHDSSAAQRYKQILPSLLLSETGSYNKKFLTTNLQFNPDSQTFKIVTLRPRGFLTQQFKASNIIPWTYADMLCASPLPEPVLPIFIDDTMVYYNRFLNENLIFENDGTWNSETIQHEKLQLDYLIDEKEWFDRRHLY